MTAEAVESIWDAAVALYRSGVHPAVQVCLRRNGAVVLDRAIGHARGNGPADGAEVEKVTATPETPFPDLFGFQGDHGLRSFTCSTSAVRSISRIRWLGTSRAMTATARARSRSPTCWPTGRGYPTCPRRRLTWTGPSDREFLVANSVRGQAVRQAGTLPRLPRRLRRVHPRRGRVQRRPGRTSVPCWPRRSSSPWGSAGTTTAWRPRTSTRWPINYLTGPPTAPPLSQLLTRALGLGLDELVRVEQRPSLPNCDRAFGECRDDGQ